MLLKPNGKGKLSKRDGDAGGFPVFPLEWKDPKTGDVSRGYREEGYYPEAFLNIIAMLGWNPGTEQEIFNLNELIQAFDIQKVGKSEGDLFKISNEFEISVKKLVTYNKLWFKNYFTLFNFCRHKFN